MYGGRQRQYEETEGEDSHLQAKKRGLNRSFCQSLEGRNPGQHLSSISSLLSETIHFHGLSHSVCGTAMAFLATKLIQSQYSTSGVQNTGECWENTQVIRGETSHSYQAYNSFEETKSAPPRKFM